MVKTKEKKMTGKESEWLTEVRRCDAEIRRLQQEIDEMTAPLRQRIEEQSAHLETIRKAAKRQRRVDRALCQALGHLGCVTDARSGVSTCPYCGALLGVAH